MEEKNINMELDYILQSTYSNYNYGSVLQCYATQRYLQNFNLDCFLVNEKLTSLERVYFAFIRRIEYKLLSLKYKDITEEKNRMLRANKQSKLSIDSKSLFAIEQFIANNIKVKKCSFAELIRISRNVKCKMCLAGSDQIWNTSRVYINPIYFLTFAPANKRVAFAPSFGAKTIRDYNVKRYQKLLTHFSKLSCREESGKDIITKLIKRDSTVIMDPVFLLSRDDWNNLAEAHVENSLTEKYVFAFFLDEPNAKAIKALKELHDEGYVIETIAYDHKAYHNYAFDIISREGGPELFLKLIKNAEYIITDSFHATAFASIFQKKFAVYRRQYSGADQSERLIDFLKKTKLIHRYEMSISNIMEELDFTEMKNLIDTNIITVKQYLEID